MNIRDIIYRYLVDHYPRIVIDHRWKKEYGYRIDWNNPRDLNEKIQWLICYGDTSQWPKLADKYRVREYVKSKGLGHLLPEIFGVWEDANDIDFDALPDRFVLKCNHDSGSTCIIDKSAGYNKELIIKNLNNHLKKRYGYLYCEPHYNKIKPLIIAQQLLESHQDTFSTQLVDYRIWCFNGVPFSIWVDHYSEEYHHTHQKFISLYDLDWNYHPEFSSFSELYQDGKGIVPRPDNLSEMIDAARILSQGQPEARVDFYNIDGILYFGEITLTSNRGRISFYKKTYLEELGEKVILPKNR